MSLNHRQAQFVAEYLIDLHATNAALRAGYSPKTAAKIGSENLQKPEIQDAITEAMKARERRTLITSDRVLAEVARLAFLDIRKAFDVDGNFKPIHELDDDTAAAIAGIEVSEMVTDSGLVSRLKKIRLADKRASLELAGRHLQLWTDKQIVENRGVITTVVHQIID